jgi:hypothetical protein
MEIESESESESLYDRRFTDNQFVLAPSILRIKTRDFFLDKRLRSQSLCNVFSDERIGLSFNKRLGPC